MDVARKSGCISPTEDVTSIENTVRLHSRIYMFAPHPKIGRVTVISMDHSALQHGTICQGVTLFFVSAAPALEAISAPPRA